ncbi:MAG: efflux RND transporter permease subunit, partial [Spirochaetota bacterium]
MKNDIFYILLFITVVLIGLFSLIKMPVLLLPSYEEKVLSIITEYYGMEPLIIEEIITKPIEIALKDITGIKNIYSYSSRGKSKILVYLEKNEDINKKSVLIKDAISKVSILFPEECHQPAVYRYNTDDQPVMIFSVYSSTISNKDLFSYIDSFLKKKILAIEGVANVEIYGRSNDEYFISLYEDAIFHSNIDYRMIFQNIVSNSINIPISKSYSENSKIQINFPNKFTNMFDIKKLKFPSEKNNSGKNQLINSEDILTIEKKEKENDRISLVNNKDTLTVLIYKKSNASILNISHNVRKIINNERKIFSYDIISDQGIVFSNLLTQLKYTIVISLLIVLSLTYLFFRNKIYLFLIGFSIPVSIFSSLTALAFSKSSLNIMTLSGIIIGIGTCLDNSIVMVEFIEYNLNNFNDIDDILSKSVYSSYRSLIASTLTTIIVFIPFFFIGMRQQQLYQDFAISISIILIVSCAYSILFIPAVIKRLSISYPEKIFNILQTKENKKVKLNILKRNSLMFLIKLKKEKENYIKQSSNLIKKTLINVKNVKTQIIIAFFLIACAIATILFFMTFSEEISPMTEKEFTVYFEFEPKYSNDYKYDKMIEIGQLLEKVRYNSIIYSRLEGTLC